LAIFFDKVSLNTLSFFVSSKV